MARRTMDSTDQLIKYNREQLSRLRVSNAPVSKKLLKAMQSLVESMEQDRDERRAALRKLTA